MDRDGRPAGLRVRAGSNHHLSPEALHENEIAGCHLPEPAHHAATWGLLIAKRQREKWYSHCQKGGGSSSSGGAGPVCAVGVPSRASRFWRRSVVMRLARFWARVRVRLGIMVVRSPQ